MVIYIYIYVCVCVCVCVRERERERECVSEEGREPERERQRFSSRENNLKVWTCGRFCHFTICEQLKASVTLESVLRCWNPI